MKIVNPVRVAMIVGVFVAGTVLAPTLAAAVDAPKPGESPRVDAIVKAGKLRAGVLTNPPWLIENMSGTGERWAGPAWELVKRAAADLGVKVEAVEVSHETKIPALGSNQVDICVTPLAWSEERTRVIDFVTYSNSSVCMYGQASNKKFSNAKTVDDLDKPDVTIAYLIGSPEEAWTKQRFPHAVVKGVISSSPTPVEEIMTGRSDAAPINRIQWPKLQRTVKGLIALPGENNCQDSEEKAAAIGFGIDKGQDVFRDWLQSLANEIRPQLRDVEQRIIKDRL